MRVLLVAPSYSIHSHKLARFLAEEGCATVLADTGRLPPQPALNFRFRELFRTNLPVQRFQWIYRLNQTLQVYQARRWIADERPDVVNIHWLDARAAVWIRAGTKPVVMSCWGSDVNQFFSETPPPFAFRVMLGHALAKSSAVTADSNEVLTRCEILAGKPLKKMIFHIGIDTSLFHDRYHTEAVALRRKLGIAVDAQVILSCRRLHRQMGQEHVLNAMSQIVQRRALPNPILVFKRYLTESAEFEHSLRTTVAKLGLEQRVAWLEPTPYTDVPIHYAIADAVVNYPEADAAPVSLFEAAACKRPIVSADLPVYREVFGDSIVFVPLTRPDLLAQSIEKVITRGISGQNKQIETAYAAAKHLGNARTNCRRLIELFEEVRCNVPSQV